jgi:predicted house-cleaning noncanonical NTP pyrophosphatase (MazG superfamily)
LVRNKIITIIENRGSKAIYEILNDDNYLKELNRKLVEEVNEFIEENAVEELADI